jgi:hypothetical protein
MFAVRRFCRPCLGIPHDSRHTLPVPIPAFFGGLPERENGFITERIEQEVDECLACGAEILRSGHVICCSRP